jgi:hypothetical protein
MAAVARQCHRLRYKHRRGNLEYINIPRHLSGSEFGKSGGCKTWASNLLKKQNPICGPYDDANAFEIGWLPEFVLGGVRMAERMSSYLLHKSA